MVGMSQIKRKFYTGLGIGLGVAVVLTGVVGVISYTTIKSYEDGTNQNYIKNFTKEISVTNQSIMQGQTITNDMLKKVRVHINMVPQGVVNSVGTNEVAKYNIGSGMPITNDMITEEIIDKDLRETEVSTILMPTNLVEGSYVDIRIRFNNGTDYIVLPEVQVKRILNTTMWLDLTEEQRSIISSAEVDSYLNDGAKLYAIEYVDEMQIVEAEENVEKIVKGQLESLIKKELPELYTAAYSDIVSNEVNEKAEESATSSDKDSTNKEEKDWLEDDTNKTTNQTTISSDARAEYESKVASEKASMIFDFIVKYRNLTATTTSTVATYQPTRILIEAMKANPNITKEAKEKLNSEVRNAIESLNNRASDEYDKDESKLVSGANQAISTQQSLRNSVMVE